MVVVVTGLLGPVTSSQAQTPRPPTYDFTGDGTSDLLYHHSNQRTVAIWDFEPNGSITYRTIGQADAPWSIQGAGDYNGDGTSDILFRHGTTGAVGYWAISNGLLTGFVPLRWDTDPTWTIVSSRGRSDLNGDGRDDILRRHADGEIRVYRMTGGGPFEFVWDVLGHVPPSWAVRGTGDFNGDGPEDILWQSTESGGVGYWAMNGGVLGWTELLPSLDLSWQARGIGDFDGDGLADIYWRNETTNEEGWWDIDGGLLSGFRPSRQTVFAPMEVRTGDYAGDGSEDFAFTSPWQGPPHIPGPETATIEDYVSGTVTRTRRFASYDPRWNVQQRSFIVAGGKFWRVRRPLPSRLPQQPLQFA